MSEAIFENWFYLTLTNKKTESEYLKMRDKKILFFSTAIISFSMLASWATMIFQYIYYQENEEIKLFKLNVTMTTIASIIYVLMLVIGVKTKNIKIIRFINTLFFTFKFL
jgi:hypothetical protein